MPSKEHCPCLYSAPIIECSKHAAADVVAKAQAVLSEPELLRAMFDVGYFPPNVRASAMKVAANRGCLFGVRSRKTRDNARSVPYLDVEAV